MSTPSARGRTAFLPALLVPVALLPLGCGRADTRQAVATPSATSSATAPAVVMGETAPATRRGPAEETAMRTAEFVTSQGQKVKLSADGDPWADRVVSFKPGKPAATDATDPKATLGPPDYDPVKEDSATYLAMGHGGELVLEFIDNVLIDGEGDDLVVFEIGPAVEPIDVAISTDGKTWIEVGRVKGAKSTLDIGPYVKPGQEFHFARLTDAKAGLSNNSKWPGADLDAVGAIHTLNRRSKP